MQPAPQDIQLMSKHRVLSIKPQLRLEWRDQDGQNEKEQPYHSASLGDSIAPSRRIGFSVHMSLPRSRLSRDRAPSLPGSASLSPVSSMAQKLVEVRADRGLPEKSSS